jgi:hypothetical protein
MTLSLSPPANPSNGVDDKKSDRWAKRDGCND